MALYISMKTASSELTKSPISDAIAGLALQVAMERRQDNVPAEPVIDVTFLLPGEYEAPPFSGMRMGGYSPENNTLLFETAVPRHILHSDLAPEYVAVAMEDVVMHANDFFSENGIQFDFNSWQGFIGRLVQSDLAPRQLN